MKIQITYRENKDYCELIPKVVGLLKGEHEVEVFSFPKGTDETAIKKGLEGKLDPSAALVQDKTTYGAIEGTNNHYVDLDGLFTNAVYDEIQKNLDLSKKKVSPPKLSGFDILPSSKEEIVSWHTQLQKYMGQQGDLYNALLQKVIKTDAPLKVYVIAQKTNHHLPFVDLYGSSVTGYNILRPQEDEEDYRSGWESSITLQNMRNKKLERLGLEKIPTSPWCWVEKWLGEAGYQGEVQAVNAEEILKSDYGNEDIWIFADHHAHKQIEEKTGFGRDRFLSVAPAYLQGDVAKKGLYQADQLALVKRMYDVLVAEITG
jgi:hypothetical protein